MPQDVYEEGAQLAFAASASTEDLNGTVVKSLSGTASVSMAYHHDLNVYFEPSCSIPDTRKHLQ